MKDGASPFVFRKNDSIGEAAAEDELNILADCFVDTGDLTLLLDCAESKRVIVGRTGAGKSALIATIAARKENVVQISPHVLSLNYIANSNVIQFFEEVGVSLTPFYILLWKHIFVVELLKAKYKILTEENQRTTMNRLRQALYKKDKVKAQAVEYLEEWGNRFWVTTEERMSELTAKVEQQLQGAIGGSALGIEATARAARTLSSEQKSQIVQRGRTAVSTVQIRELENMIQVLQDEVFSDRQEVFYLTIDSLDEEWVDDRIKYRLIKALLDTIRTFKKVEQVKIIMAIRRDLLEKVLHTASDPGMQVEKYETLFLHLDWSAATLTALLEKRLNRLVRRRYTGQPIAIAELIPHVVDGEAPLEYILDRTFLRPRDVILFLNECIRVAADKPTLTASVIKQAEGAYSQQRLESLAYEWQIAFPSLKAVAQIFCGMTPSFPVSAITKEFIDERYAEIIGDIDPSKKDLNVEMLNNLYNATGNFLSIRSSLVVNLYLVGLFGIKTGPTVSTNWISRSRVMVSPSELRAASIISIHPMFHRALAIRRS